MPLRCTPLLRVHVALAAAFAAVALAAPRAGAQELADRNAIALRWTLGEWASPLLCEKEGVARRGLRRVVITPASRDERPPRPNKLVFHPLGLPEGARCYSDTGEPQPELAGMITFFLEGISRPDLGARDFQEALQREGGFEFSVRAGQVQVDGRRVDFAGGKARFDAVRRGSDAARRLRDVDAPHKLSLALEAPDGTRVALDLALAGPGRPAR